MDYSAKSIQLNTILIPVSAPKFWPSSLELQ